MMPIETKLTWLIISALVLASLLMILIEYTEGQDTTALTLAKALVAECNNCDWHPDLKPAIANVFLKRNDEWNRNNKRAKTLERTIKDYCSLWKLDGLSEQAKRIRHYKPNHGRIPSSKWSEVMSFAEEFTLKPHDDPLPMARHFGGKLAPDLARAHRAGWKEVRRYCKGKRCVIFWR